MTFFIGGDIGVADSNPPTLALHYEWTFLNRLVLGYEYQTNNGQVSVGYSSGGDSASITGLVTVNVYGEASVVPTVIDIKPSKNSENVISFKKDKNLKVAILGSEAFDALQVDSATVKFDSNKENPASPIRFKGQDYNRDGYPDLILTLKLNETGIACGDTEATLTGDTYGGETIEGSDTFTVEPCP